MDGSDSERLRKFREVAGEGEALLFRLHENDLPTETLCYAERDLARAGLHGFVQHVAEEVEGALELAPPGGDAFQTEVRVELLYRPDYSVYEFRHGFLPHELPGERQGTAMDTLRREVFEYIVRDVVERWRADHDAFEEEL